jgi:murein DD-endopeptidase MepM/ murein hydrolase activator NlpD
MRYLTLLISISVFGILTEISAQNKLSHSIVVLDKPGFPFTFELDPGDSINVSRTYNGQSVNRIIKLYSITPFKESNCWFKDPLIRKNYYQADIDLDVSGKRVTLHHRPYQMPETVNGLRIYIENIREWDEHGYLGRTGQLEKMARISVCLEDEPWGPQDIIFPINNYRWRAAVYNNTWSGLVPFNLLYYHRGEDYGAIPDLLDVVSPVDGRVTATPLPSGDGESDLVLIENSDRLIFTFAHMNIETISKNLTLGAQVKAGTILGKTGMTWDGKKSQYSDPHLHVEFTIGKMTVATFPYMMEAYLRKYPDKVIAIAGGYRSAVPGERVELDATRSFTRDNSPIKKASWQLSDGRSADDPITFITYTQPGIYSEELTVESSEGYQDKDFLYVIVYDPARGRNTPFGWAYYYPVRGIRPGDEVLFWNRLVGTTADVLINYGDDPSWHIIKEDTTHIYTTTGEYVVTLRSSGPEKEPVTLKMAVYIEN